MPSRFYTLVVDARDPAALARFWADVLDWKIFYESRRRGRHHARTTSTFPGARVRHRARGRSRSRTACTSTSRPTTGTPRSNGSSRLGATARRHRPGRRRTGSCSPIPKATSSACCRRAKAGCSARLPRQAEHALGDDVALDLARAAGDRAAERAQVLRSPTSPRATSAGRAGRRRARRRPSASAPSSSACCSDSLPNSLSSECSGDDLPRQELREAAVAHRACSACASIVEARDRVAEHARRRRGGRRRAPARSPSSTSARTARCTLYA